MDFASSLDLISSTELHFVISIVWPPRIPFAFDQVVRQLSEVATDAADQLYLDKRLIARLISLVVVLFCLRAILSPHVLIPPDGAGAATLSLLKDAPTGIIRIPERLSDLQFA
jgi:hypothetical protein